MYNEILSLTDSLYCGIIEDGLEVHTDEVLMLFQTIKDLKLSIKKIYTSLISLISLIRLYNIESNLMAIVFELELEMSQVYYRNVHSKSFDLSNIYYIGYQKVVKEKAEQI